MKRVFEDAVLADNVVEIRRRAGLLDTDDRFEMLRSWVLPSDNEVRLGAAYTASHPVEPLVDDHPLDRSAVAAAQQQGKRRVGTGGGLVSPVFDLIETAREAGHLERLRLQVEAMAPQEEVPLRARLSLLAMIAIETGNPDTAGQYSDALYRRFVAQTLPSFRDRLPETLLVHFSVMHGVLTEECLLYLNRMVDVQIRGGINHGPSAWDVGIVALLGQAKLSQRAGDERSRTWNLPPDLRQWHPVTRHHAWSHGQGFAPAHWHVSGHRAELLSRTDDEFLLFQSPLRGDYSVEFLCSCFGWREIHPFVGGSWLTPLASHKSVQRGRLMRYDSNIPMQPPLSRMDDWVSYRVDVRGDRMTRWINGRRVDEVPLTPEHDPWLAIRNPSVTTGAVKHVCIFGNPEIPKVLRLSELRTSDWPRRTESSSSDPGAATSHPVTHLDGWYCWHEDPWRVEQSTWQLTADANDATEIIGRHWSDMPGVGLERLLRYHWPLVWDCSLTYQFYYEPRQTEVHPALGSRAFLLRPEGVCTHWITNDIWDKTNLDPLNSTPSGNHIRNRPLPLRVGTWNDVTLNLQGDRLDIVLNGETVHSTEVAITSDRCFGLFHYCDATAARVRHVVLQGDWPRSLPAPVDQELRSPQTDELDRQRDALAGQFVFDFASADYTDFSQKFLTELSDTATLSMLPDGVRFADEASQREARTNRISPRIAMSGDFDVTLTYADLEAHPSTNGTAAIQMAPRFPGTKFHALLLWHGTIQHPDTPLRSLTQIQQIRIVEGMNRTSYASFTTNESTSGKLRMARRGETISFLMSRLDSPEFQLLHSEPISPKPVKSGHLLLRSHCNTQDQNPSKVRVLWKRLEVRAEEIEELFLEPALD